MERHLHQQEDPLVAFDREKTKTKNTLYIGFIYRHFPPFIFSLFGVGYEYESAFLFKRCPSTTVSTHQVGTVNYLTSSFRIRDSVITS